MKSADLKPGMVVAYERDRSYPIGQKAIVLALGYTRPSYASYTRERETFTVTVDGIDHEVPVNAARSGGRGVLIALDRRYDPMTGTQVRDYIYKVVPLRTLQGDWAPYEAKQEAARLAQEAAWAKQRADAERDRERALVIHARLAERGIDGKVFPGGTHINLTLDDFEALLGITVTA